MTLTDDELMMWNQQGLIPGPDENEENFERRATFCRTLKNTFVKDVGSEISGEFDAALSRHLIHEVAPLTRELFDIVPDWVPIIFSNHRMSFWHGGSAWIFQLNEESPTAAFFQLREVFADKLRYLGFYERNELLAHESSHVGRMLFEEPKFEELLAYRTSNSPFRRWIGPIVQSPWESLLFVIVLLLSFLGDLLITISGYADPNHSMLWIKLLPLLLIFIGLGRVWRRHHQFDKCLKKLRMMLGSDSANAVIYRLLDEEVIAFGAMSERQILEYASMQALESLRWRVIKKAYFESFS